MIVNCLRVRNLFVTNQFDTTAINFWKFELMLLQMGTEAMMNILFQIFEKVGTKKSLSLSVDIDTAKIHAIFKTICN